LQLSGTGGLAPANAPKPRAPRAPKAPAAKPPGMFRSGVSGALLGAGAMGGITAIRNSASSDEKGEKSPSVVGSMARGAVAGGALGAASATTTGRSITNRFKIK
jgi:hypothetical protein